MKSSLYLNRIHARLREFKQLIVACGIEKVTINKMAQNAVKLRDAWLAAYFRDVQYIQTVGGLMDNKQVVGPERDPTYSIGEIFVTKYDNILDCLNDKVRICSFVVKKRVCCVYQPAPG